MSKTYDLLILGGGVCGMTAAIYAARSNLSVCILEQDICGGLVNWTHTVENMPSYKKIHGIELMQLCKEQADELGINTEELVEISSIELDGAVKKVHTVDAGSYAASAIILATGRKPIALPVETEFENVHYCSICDGPAYKDKNVIVIGGGNSGFDESLYLADIGVKSIHIVEAMDNCIAAQSTQDRAKEIGIIKVSVATRLIGLEQVGEKKALAILEKAGETFTEEVDGVFCFIGQSPNTQLFKDLLPMERGYIITDEAMKTPLEGVFVAGDVRVKKYRQITTAMADGTIAALEATAYIRSR